MYVNTLASHRNRGRFSRDTEGGTGGGGGSPEGGGGSGGSDGGTGGSGFTPITSQEEFDSRISRRISQVQGRYADYDLIKEKAQAFDALEAESRTEHERAVAMAKETAEQEVAARFIPRLVTTEFKVAAAGKLTAEQVTSLLEDVDLTKYVKSDGEPDTEKITKKITALVGIRNTGTGHPDLGQGGGRGDGGPKKGEAGLAEAQRRHPEIVKR